MAIGIDLQYIFFVILVFLYILLSYYHQTYFRTDDVYPQLVGSNLSCLICNCDIATQSDSHSFPFVLACNSYVAEFRKKGHLNRNYCDRIFLFVHSTFNPLNCYNDIISNC